MEEEKKEEKETEQNNLDLPAPSSQHFSRSYRPGRQAGRPANTPYRMSMAIRPQVQHKPKHGKLSTVRE